ncbi:MAG: preprotein translocase subunit SecY [Oscillospiraceae bacterium]|nr:preprotein translocase subunit SecY [Oscillospiraceae bacterium]MBR3935539.1 preprotein translocase subunit SecY [Oscillospiraceae bacterium]
MFDVFKNAWKVEDIREKLLYTLLIIVIFRLGAAIPVPFLDTTALSAMFAANSGNLLGYLNMLTGGALSMATVFALSISPYITSSIVIQLLTVAIPALEKMAKEGPEGKKKINMITRWSTVALALIQSYAYYVTLKGYNAVASFDNGWENALVIVTILFVFTAGSMLVMWLGERIDEKGIGNGISMILFAGIVSGGPRLISTLWAYLTSGEVKYYFFVPALVIIFVLLIAFIVLMNQAERRIPVQYAKRVVGRKQYGGQSSHIPVKVTMAGVLPIIFAGAILAIPSTIEAFVNVKAGSFWEGFFNMFEQTHWLYSVLYFVLIVAFSYFYIAIQYNPVEMANNLQKNNGAIPGIRPGKPTADFISRIIGKITFIGAMFLGIIALLPTIIGAVSGIQGVTIGGTTVIIVVSVALETARSLESQMMMRHYKGFLE